MMNAVLGMFNRLAINSTTSVKAISLHRQLSLLAVPASSSITSDRGISTTTALSSHSRIRMMDLRRHKMLKKKRKKRWHRDYFEYQKKQLQKKMKSEVLFRARMKEITDDLNAFDAMTYVKDIIENHPHWSQLMELEEVFGVEKSEYIDKRAGIPSPEDKAKIEEAKAEYLKKYSC